MRISRAVLSAAAFFALDFLKGVIEIYYTGPEIAIFFFGWVGFCGAERLYAGMTGRGQFSGPDLRRLFGITRRSGILAESHPGTGECRAGLFSDRA